MKIWKYMLMTAAVSAGLTACLKGDGWEEEHAVPVPDPVTSLAVELSTPSVIGNDDDYVEVTVRYEGEPVTEGVEFYTNDKSLLDPMTPAAFATRAGEEGPYNVTEYFVPTETGFRLKIAYAGLFTFWVEYNGADTKQTPESVKAVPAGLYAELAKTTVVADGRDSAEVLVYYQGRQVTSGVKFFDTNDNPADEFFTDMRYRTTTAGEFRFYVAYESLDTKTDPLTVTAVEPDEIEVPAVGMFVYLSSTVVRADGKDAVTVKVFFDGVEITDQATYYRLPDNTEVDLSGGVYTTTTAGTFSFWVSYKAENTFNTPSTITAVDFSIPERPVDPNPSSTNFVRRVQVLQFTGTGCGYCPLMMTTLRNLAANEDWADKFLVAACHSYNPSDPMYLGNTGSSLASSFGVSSYPSVVMDMREMLSTSTESYVRNKLELNYNRAAAFAGIAVKSEMAGNTVVAHVAVKTAVDKALRVGIMVLEDGIKATQSNNNNLSGDFNTHNNTIRSIDATRTFKGYDLGTVKAGNVVDQIFALNLDDKWVKENCRLMVYVCSDEGSGFHVNNVVATDGLATELPFEYAE